MDDLIKLWKQGHSENASFPVGLQSQTPRQAAELCGMRCIEIITEDGGVTAINKWGHRLVILSVYAGPYRGPVAVDVTFESLVTVAGILGILDGDRQH